MFGISSFAQSPFASLAGTNFVFEITEARLNSHEAVCAERYEQINARLKRIEGILMKTAGVMLVAMSGVVYASVAYVR
jgi:hypothetical protein